MIQRLFSIGERKPIQIRIHWKHSVGNGFNRTYSFLHPFVKDDLVFASDGMGTIKALNIFDGTEIWSKKISGSFEKFHRNSNLEKLSSGLIVQDNYLYLGSELARLYAIDIHTGKTVWICTVSGEVLSEPIVQRSTLLIRTNYGIIQALGSRDGKIRWTTSLGASFDISFRKKSSPIIFSDTVVLGDDNGKIFMLNIDTGEIIWKKTLFSICGNTNLARINNTFISYQIRKNAIYVSSYNSGFVALNLISNKIIWFKNVGSMNDFLFKKNRIYLIDQNHCILSIDSKNGNTIWKQKMFIHKNLTNLTFFKNFIIFCDDRGYLYWISKDNGNFFYKKRIDPSGFFSPPIVVKNRIIVQSKKGTVYMINSKIQEKFQ